MTATTIGWSTSAFDFSITTNDATTFGNPNDFQALFGLNGNLNPNSVTTNAVDSIGASFVFPTFNYSFTSSSEIRTINTASRSIAYYFLGTFHDSTGFYNDSDASLTLQFTQSAAETSVSGSGTFSTPPAPFTGAPEPASMALLGSALVGLGLFGRKRLAR